MQPSPDPHIGTIAEAHSFLHDNEYILSGYRIYFNSTGRILKSLFMLHNESANVWSHLAGVLLFFALTGYTAFMLDLNPATLAAQIGTAVYAQMAKSMSDLGSVKVDHFYVDICERAEEVVAHLASFVADTAEGSWGYLSIFFSSLIAQLCADESVSPSYQHLLSGFPNPSFAIHRCKRYSGPIFVFIASVLVCLGCSTFYHLFNAHSAKVHALTSRLDYAGTSLLISGSYYPVIYYIFFCRTGTLHTDLIILFLTGISLGSICVFALSLTESFQQPKYRTLRGLIFLALGLMGGIPMVYLFFFM